MNFLRNTKKHFDLVLILMLMMALFIICLCSCKRPETKTAEIKTEPIETKLSTTFVIMVMMVIRKMAVMDR